MRTGFRVRSTVATLKEAVLAVREGCRISTFALIEDYWGMDWVGFVDQLTRLTKGLAFYTSEHDVAYNLLMAAATLVVLPVVVIFIFAQRFFVEGITVGGVKG